MMLVVDERREENDDAADREDPRDPIEEFDLREWQFEHGHIRVQNDSADKEGAGNDKRLILRGKMAHTGSMRHFWLAASRKRSILWTSRPFREVS